MALAGLTRFDIGEQAEDPVAMHLAVMDSEKMCIRDRLKKNGVLE